MRYKPQFHFHAYYFQKEIHLILTVVNLVNKKIQKSFKYDFNQGKIIKDPGKFKNEQKILIKLIQRVSMSKISKMSQYGRLKLNGLQRDHRPVILISHTDFVGVKYEAYLHTFFELFILPTHYGFLLDSLDAFIDSVSKIQD